MKFPRPIYNSFRYGFVLCSGLFQKFLDFTSLEKLENIQLISTDFNKRNLN